ncbi:MAG: hypothetical protein ABIM59_01780 [candidate division WOR-3 bacterium]
MKRLVDTPIACKSLTWASIMFGLNLKEVFSMKYLIAFIVGGGLLLTVGCGQMGQAAKALEEIQTSITEVKDDVSELDKRVTTLEDQVEALTIAVDSLKAAKKPTTGGTGGKKPPSGGGGTGGDTPIKGGKGVK